MEASKVKILIAHINQKEMNQLDDILSQNNYETLITDNNEDASRAISTFMPDLIFSDIHLLEMFINKLEKLIHKHVFIPIIFIGPQSEHSQKKKQFDPHLVSFIPTPFTSEMVLSKSYMYLEFKKTLDKMKFEEENYYEIKSFYLEKDKIINKLNHENIIKNKVIEDQAHHLVIIQKNKEHLFNENVYQNIDVVIKPYLMLLKNSGLNAKQKKFVQKIEHTIDHITHAVGNLTQIHFPDMTSNEIKIIEMIRENLSSKEISCILNLSESTIFEYRKQIRKKIGLTNTNKNLKQYLRDMHK
jgi:response regulator RpfG family c-di-GMP phosphodiesterase